MADAPPKEKADADAETDALKRLVRESIQARTALKMEVPFGMQDAATYRQFSLYQLIYSLSGLVLGLTCVIGGIVLFLHGVTGTTSWTARMLGAESQISDAAPGAVLFIVGLFVVLITRFTIKLRK